MTELEKLALEAAISVVTKAIGIAVDAAARGDENDQKLLADIDAKVQGMAAKIAAVKFRDV